MQLTMSNSRNNPLPDKIRTHAKMQLFWASPLAAASPCLEAGFGVSAAATRFRSALVQRAKTPSMGVSMDLRSILPSPC